MFVHLFHGFCMALADSVPGVSGGTIAFILGFYDRFLNALHDLFGKDPAARRPALRYLVKLGAGWVIGMGLARPCWHRCSAAGSMCSVRPSSG